ncbi:MAG: hypothetical protein QHJ34_15330 [bacterium]|jgi:hypothetical protein|nr:hypothetical protein [candidate division KSB1 bacterium]MDH7561575.1 hypothetical protein [bacterium]
MRKRVPRQLIPNHAQIDLLVGGASFVTAGFSMFVFMGLPIACIPLAIASGITTGLLLVRKQKLGEQVSEQLGVQVGLISGALGSLGLAIPLIALAIMAPKGATIGQEFSKWFDPTLIPKTLNTVTVATSLVALLSVIVMIGLNIECCTSAIKWHKRRRAKE